MVRSPCVDKNGLKKGSWSEEEDNKLRAYVLRFGHWNWRQLPKFAGISRCGKSCRLRWMNYLRPGVKRGNYTAEEEDLIIKLHEQFGNKYDVTINSLVFLAMLDLVIKLHEQFGNRWSAIAGRLSGRTDNEIKNYWHTHLRKRMNQDPRSNQTMDQTSEKSRKMDDVDQIKQSAAMSIIDSNQKREMEPNIAAAAPASYTEISSLSDVSKLFDSSISVESFVEPFESFWTQPFALDTSYDSNAHWYTSLSDVSTLFDSNISVESFTEPFESLWTQPFALDTSYDSNAHWLPPLEEEFAYHFFTFAHNGMD